MDGKNFDMLKTLLNKLLTIQHYEFDYTTMGKIWKNTDLDPRHQWRHFNITYRSNLLSYWGSLGSKNQHIFLKYLVNNFGVNKNEMGL